MRNSTRGTGTSTVSAGTETFDPNLYPQLDTTQKWVAKFLSDRRPRTIDGVRAFLGTHASTEYASLCVARFVELGFAKLEGDVVTWKGRSQS